MILIITDMSIVNSLRFGVKSIKMLLIWVGIPCIMLNTAPISTPFITDGTL